MYIFNQVSINKNKHSKLYFYSKLNDGFMMDLLYITFYYCNHKIKHWK